jgi:hypothetical protein
MKQKSRFRPGKEDQLMATINQHGPYYLALNPGLPPEGAHNFRWGPSDIFKLGGVINVTGHPNGRLARTYAVWVSDMSIENVVTATGDISLTETNVYATFQNSGREVIEFITAYISVTTV